MIRIEGTQPILSVSDMKQSLHFYCDILGFNAAEWGSENFTSVNKDGGGIYLCKGAQGQPGTWVWVGFDGDINMFYSYLLSHNVTVLHPPVNYSWAQELQVQDPDGHILRFGKEPDTAQPFADQ
ncbi:MAG: VOC family protein [Chitinophagaceae bacterium]|nr:VOC family protein [Chitinophagaceae bacterium]